MELDEIIGYFQAVAEAFEGNCPVTPTEYEYAMIAAIPYLRKAKDYEEWTDSPVCQSCGGNICVYLPDFRDDDQEARLFCDGCGKEYIMSAFYRVKEQACHEQSPPKK